MPLPGDESCDGGWGGPSRSVRRARAPRPRTALSAARHPSVSVGLGFAAFLAPSSPAGVGVAVLYGGPRAAARPGPAGLQEGGVGCLVSRLQASRAVSPVGKPNISLMGSNCHRVGSDAFICTEECGCVHPAITVTQQSPADGGTAEQPSSAPSPGGHGGRLRCA